MHDRLSVERGVVVARVVRRRPRDVGPTRRAATSGSRCASARRSGSTSRPTVCEAAGLRVSNVVECGWCDARRPGDVARVPAAAVRGDRDDAGRRRAGARAHDRARPDALDWDDGGRRARTRARTRCAPRRTTPACASRSRTRARCASTSRSRRRCATPSTSRSMLGSLRCAWSSTRAGPSGRSTQRSAPRRRAARARAGLRRDRSAASARPTGSCPATATSRSAAARCSSLRVGYAGAFEIEMVGPRIDDEGYEPAIRRAIDVHGPDPALGAMRRAPAWHDRSMTDSPWLGDACSLVDAFRAGERSPVEELEATLAAIDAQRSERVLVPRP